MIFWIFMFVMVLLLPITMMGFGRYFRDKAPKDINGVFGYRTSMSMKNKDTWEFAHHYCGRIWYNAGRLLFLTALPMFFVIGKDMESVGDLSTTIVFIQMIPMIATMFFTERALKKHFDKNGNRKD